MMPNNLKITLEMEIRNLTDNKLRQILNDVQSGEIIPFKKLLEIYPIDEVPIRWVQIKTGVLDRDPSVFREASIELVC